MAFLYNFNYNDECSVFTSGLFIFPFCRQVVCLQTFWACLSWRWAKLVNYILHKAKFKYLRTLLKVSQKTLVNGVNGENRIRLLMINDKYQDSSWKYQLFWLFAILIPGDSDLSETSKKKLCVKSSIFDVWLGSEYTSECKYNTWNNAKNIAFDDEREMKYWMWIPSVTIRFNMLVLRLRVTKIRG